MKILLIVLLSNYLFLKIQKKINFTRGNLLIFLRPNTRMVNKIALY